MKTLQGKGFFIWQIPSCENGDAGAIAKLAHKAQLSHVIVKVADNVSSYNIYEGVDLVPPVVRKLRKLGIQVWGWHYVRGDNPLAEADKGIERVQTLGLDGYVIDAEGPYKERGKAAAAEKFMARLREGLPKTPIALSSYRFPSYHRQLPWQQFLEVCDYNMPQVYWMFSEKAGEQLTRSVREFQAITPTRPIIPTGAAFKEHGWKPDAAQVIDFLQTAKDLNLPAANLYSWDSCRRYLPEIWQANQDFEWLPLSSPRDITERYVTALNTLNPDRMINLYNSNAVHITSARTIQGFKDLRIWYQALFFSLLPNAKFSHTGFSQTKNSRHLTWTAESDFGAVHNGRDTFGLHKGKITYHFSTFTITQGEAA
jgi:hypothetical protein